MIQLTKEDLNKDLINGITNAKYYIDTENGKQQKLCKEITLPHLLNSVIILLLFLELIKENLGEKVFL